MTKQRAAIVMGLVGLYLVYVVGVSMLIEPRWVVAVLTPVWFFAGYGVMQLIGEEWLDGR